MSQTLLFSVGVLVFSITVVATLLYGYLALDRVYQADAARGSVIVEATPRPEADAAALTGSGVISSPIPALD